MKSTYFAVFALVVCLTVTCGEAKRCQTACSYDYSPVCGISKLGIKKTFANQCVMDNYNCQNPNNRHRWISNKECS